LQSILFTSASDFEPQLFELLMSTIIINYPGMVDLQAAGDVGAVARIRSCLYYGTPETELLAWSNFLRTRRAAKIEQVPRVNTIFGTPGRIQHEALIPKINDDEFGEGYKRIDYFLSTSNARVNV
jgi:hypothetical protein